jgi:AraC family transcriptional regulator of adaptative response/methylated-DNA-[protein]-cysteine methyltransferase
MTTALAPIVTPRRSTSHTLPAAEEAWAAVMARDRSYDGVFVYAVQTTGVYCRPSCPARRPRREHVRFYESPAAAEADGFRECRRCRPLRSEPSAAVARVERARAYLDAHLDEPVTLPVLAREVGMSPYHLQRIFKQHVGLSPKRYHDARRLEAFKRQLKGGATVSRATYEAGFRSSRALYTAAEAGLGMTPAAYRRGGLGVRVRYGITETPFGHLLVAATERGVCAVGLGDDESELMEWLRAELPRADLDRDEAGIAPWMSELVAHLAGMRPQPDVPLDLAGTEFQMRVWRALQRIPYGSTRSYADVARAIGRPTSARAVARACASNRVALVVPCHRVVRGDGGLGGYRWGSERKRRLLEHERHAESAPAGRVPSSARRP